MAISARTVVILDLGGVLIDWNPRHLYRKLFDGDEAAMEHFLATVCTPAWHAAHDAGRGFAEGARLLKARHPDKAALIDAFGARSGEMMAGAIAGTVEIVAELDRRSTPLYGLTNWSAEAYPQVLERFDFLARFRGVVVSGEERLTKPDPRIYRLLLERYGIAPEAAVYVDDTPRNAEAARTFGIHGIHFTTPAALRRELETLRLL